MTATGIDATNIDGKSIQLVPYSDAAGANVMSTSDFGKAVASWKCGPTSSNRIPPILSGSCRG